MFLVPEDRKLAGLVLELSVRENLAMAILPRLVRAGLFMNAAKENRQVRHWIERLGVKPPEPEKRAGQGAAADHGGGRP